MSNGTSSVSNDPQNAPEESTASNAEESMQAEESTAPSSSDSVQEAESDQTPAVEPEESTASNAEESMQAEELAPLESAQDAESIEPSSSSSGQSGQGTEPKQDFPTLARSMIEEIASEDTKENYLEALRASLGISRGQTVSSIDFDDSQSFKGSTELATLYGSQVDQLYEYHILLDRRQAVEFLYSKGYKITLNKFRNLSKSDAYDELFDRKVPKSIGNRLVYTYSEILYLVKHQIQLTMPQAPRRSR